jgi:hypothetical protein
MVSVSPFAPNTYANHDHVGEDRRDVLDENDAESVRRDLSADSDNLRCKMVKIEGSVPKENFEGDSHNSKTRSLSHWYERVCKDLDVIAVFDGGATLSTRKYPQDDCLLTASPTARYLARNCCHIKHARQNFYKGLLNHKEAVQMRAHPLHETPLLERLDEQKETIT